MTHEHMTHTRLTDSSPGNGEINSTGLVFKESTLLFNTEANLPEDEASACVAQHSSDDYMIVHMQD